MVYTQLLTARQGEGIIFQRIFLVLGKMRCYSSFMMRQKRHALYFIFFSFSFILGLPTVVLPATPAPLPSGQIDPEPATVEFFKVRQRPAQELLSEVRTILSPTGRASADTITNTLIVSDTPKHIEKVRQLIQNLDRPVPQVTVTLRYHQAETRRRTLSTASGISGSKAGLRITSGGFRRDKKLQITVSSGSTGFLMVGRKIPFTSFWLDLCSRYGYRFGWLNEYTTVGIGFEVRPLVLDNRVDLSLVPRLSFAQGRSVEFTRAQTRVAIPINTWVQIGATNSGMDEVSAAILSAGGDNDQAKVLKVMVRVR